MPVAERPRSPRAVALALPRRPRVERDPHQHCRGQPVPLLWRQRASDSRGDAACRARARRPVLVETIREPGHAASVALPRGPRVAGAARCRGQRRNLVSSVRARRAAHARRDPRAGDRARGQAPVARVLRFGPAAPLALPHGPRVLRPVPAPRQLVPLVLPALPRQPRRHAAARHRSRRALFGGRLRSLARPAPVAVRARPSLRADGGRRQERRVVSALPRQSSSSTRLADVTHRRL